MLSMRCEFSRSCFSGRGLDLLPLLPLGYLVLCVFTLGVDVLHWDEWVIWGEVLEKIDQGIFRASDLIAQQNEQRNMAARLFGLLLMPLFQLNRFAEYTVNILFACGIFGATYKLYVNTWKVKPSPFLSLSISLLTFSILQWETFTFGSNSSVIILPFAIWFGALFAISGPLTLGRLLSLGLIGVLPSFSFANGLFYWICLAPVVILQGKKARKLPLVAGTWLVMSLAAWGGYFIGFESPEHHPPLMAGLFSPLKFFGYYLCYLGGAISSDKNLFPVAASLGFFSIPAFMLLVYREWKANARSWEHLLPWVGVASFSLLSAAVTSLARCEFGITQALESRYASFATPYWVVLISLFSIEWGRKTKFDKKLWCIKWFLALCGFIFVISTVLSTIVVYNRAEPFRKARATLFSLSNEEALQRIFPDSVYLVNKLPLFFKNRLSIYRDLKLFGEYAVSKESGGTFNIVGEGSFSKGVPMYVIGGELGDSFVFKPVQVLLVANERIIAVSQSISGEKGRGWKMNLPKAFLPDGEVRLTAYLLLDEERDLLPLEPSGDVYVERGEAPLADGKVEKFFWFKAISP